MTMAKSKRERQEDPIPVTLLSGFLGSGKTTLLQHILRNKQNLRCAVIVNDMSELNIDASLVKKTKLVQAEERLVELQNGCICCTLREDLLQEVGALAAQRRKGGKRAYDYIIIESTGIGEPMQVAETFELSPAEGELPLKHVARLDTCVTVLDAATLLANMTSIETVKDWAGKGGEGGADEEDERGISGLLLDQIEFADVILCNKTDLVTKAEVKRLVACLHALNPSARIIHTRNSEVPLQEVINTGLFDFEKAAQAAGWLQSLQERHTPETEEYGISSFIYRAHRPFHPQRLWGFLQEHFLVQEPEEEEEGEGEEGGEGLAKGEEMEEGLGREERAEKGAQKGGAAGKGREGQRQPAAGKQVAGAAADAAGSKDKKLQGTGGAGEAEPAAAEDETAATAAAASLAAKRAKLHGKLGQVLRGKGCIWLAPCSDMSGDLSLAGGVVRLEPGGPWFAAMPEDVWGDVDPEKVRADFHPQCGDRRQELVFIGIGMKREVLTAALDACLCTKKEAASAASLPNPFRPWPEVEVVEVTDDEAGDESASESQDESADESEEEEEPAARQKGRQKAGRSGSEGAKQQRQVLSRHSKQVQQGAGAGAGVKRGQEAQAGGRAAAPAGKKGRRK